MAKICLKTLCKIGCGFVSLSLLLWFLSAVFSGKVILPQSISLGPVSFRYYGMILAVAVLSGLLYARKTASAFGYTKEQAENLALYLVPISFVFARAYHVLSDFAYYRMHPLEALKVWQGGLSIYGAVLGGVVTVLVFRKIVNLRPPVLNTFDWLAPSVLLGQIIGRFGNLFNYEAYGYPTNLPWKMFVPEKFRPDGYLSGSFFHPWFLYEAIANLFVFFLLNKFFKKAGTGALFFGYVLLYNIVRFCLEFIRIDSVFIGGLRQNAAVSLVLIILGLAGLIFSHKKQNV